ncbi:MAG: hypothetical protein COV59_03400 [Candidatus Magasanikbacteria bacterium CG11_big_fil_rev_8_21_14_0_20_39_34]|uniref:Uncharacterized protein n=1 Tax=Candidatus Magasanikbacteria bacterium CG11_big_fil_rev_8_21_14_0_20_39_34 TaxID=1974653 RepID=A0A2H0N5N9_9BACT|nr:MAG: hypothetical protein COV59_03400 [Candidatus Magasanikbacteria bacterium CG11_big_fil_rev_8_21_14_0_20_39_34]
MDEKLGVTYFIHQPVAFQVRLIGPDGVVLKTCEMNTNWTDNQIGVIVRFWETLHEMTPAQVDAFITEVIRIREEVRTRTTV